MSKLAKNPLAPNSKPVDATDEGKMVFEEDEKTTSNFTNTEKDKKFTWETITPRYIIKTRSKCQCWLCEDTDIKYDYEIVSGNQLLKGVFWN